MDQELSNRLDEIEGKVKQIYTSVEKTRKYFQIVLWVTIGMVVLPTLGLLFAVPVFLNSYINMTAGSL
jgi:hypothetical protein